VFGAFVVGEEAADGAPEGGGVVALDEVAELVDDDVFEDRLGGEDETGVDTDAAVLAAAAPAVAEVADGEAARCDVQGAAVAADHVVDIGADTVVEPGLQGGSQVCVGRRLRGVDQEAVAILHVDGGGGVTVDGEAQEATAIGHLGPGGDALRVDALQTAGAFLYFLALQVDPASLAADEVGDVRVRSLGRRDDFHGVRRDLDAQALGACAASYGVVDDGLADGEAGHQVSFR